MLDYDDFAIVMENERCCLCNSHIEQPYEGAVACTSEDDEFIEVIVYCSYCWPRIKRSMKRIKKKLIKEVSNFENL